MLESLELSFICRILRGGLYKKNNDVKKWSKVVKKWFGYMEYVPYISSVVVRGVSPQAIVLWDYSSNMRVNQLFSPRWGDTHQAWSLGKVVRNTRYMEWGFESPSSLQLKVVLWNEFGGYD